MFPTSRAHGSVRSPRIPHRSFLPGLGGALSGFLLGVLVGALPAVAQEVVFIDFDDPALRGRGDFLIASSRWKDGQLICPSDPEDFASAFASFPCVYEAPGNATFSVTFSRGVDALRFFFINDGASTNHARFFDAEDRQIGELSSRPITFMADPANFQAINPRRPIRRMEVTSGGPATNAIVDDVTYVEEGAELPEGFPPEESDPPPPPPDPDDPEPGVLAFAQDAFEARESDGTAGIPVRRTGGSDGRVTVRVRSGAGTVTEGADLVPVDEVLTWADGDDGVREATVALVEDEEDEGVETLPLLLSDPSGGAELGAVASAQLAVFDDDGAAGCAEEDGQTLCLGKDRRFKVQVSWLTQQGENGRGQALPLLADSGLFTFFDPNNAELLVKVLDACSFVDRHWVFLAGTTNQAFTLTVTDTGVDPPAVRFYDNPLGTVTQTVLDTDAFSTCP